MVKYYAPYGKDIENLTEDYLKDVIFNYSQDYWEKGSGDSGIEVSEYSNRIIFFYKEEYGFFIMLHPDYYVPYNINVPIETVNHRIGGELFQVPSCSFVSREEAYNIISNFIKNGDVLEKYNWVDMYEIPFEYDDFF